ncbi:MAG: hypothetical protein LBE62_00675 [Azonexus sp.]|jgi:hypothetical protein|nr:hypothetical protein [Azonexus sp.]
MKTTNAPLSGSMVFAQTLTPPFALSLSKGGAEREHGGLRGEGLYHNGSLT